MAVRWTINIDHHDLPTRLERWAHMPQKRIRFGDLMIHVHHEHPVETSLGQTRILDRTQLDRDIV